LPDNDLIPIKEAANRAGIHVNTVRGAIRDGRIKSASKVVEGKREYWFVSLQEVLTFAGNIRPDYVSTSDDNSVPHEPLPGNNSLIIQETIAAAVNQAVVPLTQLIDKQGQQIADLSREVGRLEEKLSQLQNQTRPVPAPDEEKPKKRGWFNR